jgi:hypothetical protein
VRGVALRASETGRAMIDAGIGDNAGCRDERR